jgi:FkbM family methyltransferase
MFLASLRVSPQSRHIARGQWPVALDKCASTRTESTVVNHPTIAKMSLSLKQILVRGSLGRGALIARDKYLLIREACIHPEEVGTLANDQLAVHLVTRICRANSSFIDVGAHIGSIVSEVAHNDPSIRIVAIEAIPEKAEKLRRRFPIVETHACAVGEHSGNVSFFVNTRKSGFSSLGAPKNSSVEEIHKIQVRLEKLDDLVQSHDVDTIKIDVEGAELGVLRGGIGTIRRCRPIIMFESGPPVDDGLGYSKEGIYEFLAANGFVVLVPNRVAHNDDGLSLGGFLESHRYPRRTTNYFAIPAERRIECRDRARGILRIGRR